MKRFPLKTLKIHEGFDAENTPATLHRLAAYVHRHRPDFTLRTTTTTISVWRVGGQPNPNSTSTYPIHSHPIPKPARGRPRSSPHHSLLPGQSLLVNVPPGEASTKTCQVWRRRAPPPKFSVTVVDGGWSIQITRSLQ